MDHPTLHGIVQESGSDMSISTEEDVVEQDKESRELLQEQSEIQPGSSTIKDPEYEMIFDSEDDVQHKLR